MSDAVCRDLLEAADNLRHAVDQLKFAPPVSHVYNPLQYAGAAYEVYLRRFGNTRKRVLFLGMNPGPFGMMQVGIPFGEVQAVAGWLGIRAEISRPASEHPKRPIQGFSCTRSEVSGERLWGLFARRFSSANDFFREHLVVNYCPLVFLEETGRNRTPDKLPVAERQALYVACDLHLKQVVKAVQPEWIIGVGDFAARRAEEVCGSANCRIGKILHPSPASPAANRDWAGQATAQMIAMQVWK
ncbi:MAG TPA: uracil-DNA glycosylase family protein [Verrucomicrobiae bacterium]|nr:uracil-DNA glycosylase family protein [Verrucomicrobiae bacterium]